MGRSCSVCGHAKLLAIDRRILAGDQLKAIASRFQGCSADALARHRKHLRVAIARAARPHEDASYGQNLLDQVQAIQNDIARLQVELEQSGDRRGALAAIKTKLDALRTAWEFSGGSRTDVPSQQVMTLDQFMAFIRDGAAALGWTIAENGTIDGEIVERKQQLPEATR
jgi:hypothetical protein